MTRNNKKPLGYDISPAPIRDYLRSLMKERSIPGLQIAVIRKGRIELLDKFGIANVEHQVPVSHDSVFSINSMAKAFTGIAVMQLVEDGQLDLLAKISTYLDDLPEHWQDITVYQLATLTAGVPEIMAYTADNNLGLIGDGTEESAWQTAYAAPMEYPTGNGYSYNQTSYALLGKIIERLSGKSFTNFVNDRQFKVVGMPNTRYFTDQDIVPNRADTYMNITTDGEPAGKMFKSSLNWPPVLRPAAGLHSTAEDLANWVIALQSGLLLKETSSIDKMLTVPPMYDGSPGIWGIGWHLGKSVKGGLPAPGGGAKAQVVLYPEGLGIVLLTNLLGAFPEHLAPVRAEQIDLAFVDPIARYFSS
ncbi:serine hydrolase domain-containing protein [Pseudomonas marginalis]|jgi:CubicO group peptidase (beta-lactamase class C family)|uniref:serine hydrolase domain-containing protein n=1 Tax=Pseudomonas marginalis TaxID=298 RepID=UPI002A371F8F|nr:serine hydrolase domain-containing protein [Pseudomonas marginalis]WPN25856.1 serine hydrolase domain-containing protein [Pseudomonas marginalis]